MKIMTRFYTVLLVLVFIPVSWCFAETKPASVPAKPTAVKKQKNQKVAKVTKNKTKGKKPATAKKKKPEGLVVGKNLKVGMNMDKAISLLGVPRKVTVKRGTEPSLDSISIEYEKHGVVIHAVNGKTKIEGIELLPTFKGQFANGIKMGDKVPALIEMNGVPQAMSSSLARYPDKGLYFSLKENVLVSAWIFAKNSKILNHQLLKTN